jgi:hypothetical protein
MPIVGATNNAIEIEIQGKIDDIMAKADAVDKKLDGLAAQRKANSQALAQQSAAEAAAANKAKMSWTDFRSMYQTVLDVVRVGQQVWAATGGEFVKYAEDVKNLSRNIGVTTEDASRLIQVADDVRISYESMSTAMKIAQKQGIDVSIDGLTKLADKYKSLAPGVERTQFLMKTFGRSGLEMGKLLEQGGDGVKKMSGAIEDSLVLTQDAIDKSDNYQMSVDNLTDSWHAFVVEVGSKAVPVMTDAINRMNDEAAATKLAQEDGKTLFWLTGKEYESYVDKAKAIREATEAQKLANSATSEGTGVSEDNAAALNAQKAAVEAAGKAFDDYKKMLDEVSQANQDAESFIQSYADFSKGYAKDHAQAAADLSKAVAGGNKEDIAQAQKGIQELEATWHEATQKMIYDMVLAKVSVDGLTDAEFKATQDVAVQMGIRTQAQADEAKAAMDKANSIVDGIALQEDVMKEKAQTDANLLQLENDKKAAADGTTAAIVSGATVGSAALGGLDGAIRSNIDNMNALGYAATTTGSIIMKMNMDSGGYKAPTRPVYKGGGRSPDERGVPGNALGGEFMIPMQYGNEGFNMGGMATASGGEKVTITPKGQTSGTVYNIYITNPKREAAEDSIKSALRNLVYTGSAN